MVKFTLTHEINCDVDTFWKVFFNKDFSHELFRGALQFPAYEIMELKDGDKEIFRRVSATPKMDAPAAVAKVLGSSFSYVEEGRFDKGTKIFQWKSIPSTMADKVRTEGSVRAEPAGDGKIRRVSDFSFEAKVFGLGGVIESALEKNLRHGWDESAVFMNNWLKSNR